MKLPSDICTGLTRRFATGHRDWLMQPGMAWEAPLRINLAPPTEKEVLSDIAAVRHWIDSWNRYTQGGDVVWEERAWSKTGRQRVPVALMVKQPGDVALITGMQDQWGRSVRRLTELTARWPGLTGRLSGAMTLLCQYSEDDYARVRDVLAWLLAHPASGLYVRQIPVAGIDSKWIEARMPLLTDLVVWARAGAGMDVGTEVSVEIEACDISEAPGIDSRDAGENAPDDTSAVSSSRPSRSADFYTVCGIRKMDGLIRIRLLDPALCAQFGGLSDLSVPLDDAAAMTMSPSTVLVVENLQNALALGYLPGTAVIMRRGYDVGCLSAIPWVQRARVLYWGDLDTHGFAILNRARQHVRHIESILMDLPTLLAHRELWVEEPEQTHVDMLSNLNAEEKGVYDGLKGHTWRRNLRLEQERLEWGSVMSSLEQAVATS
jgi:hypothetical protein